jgi:hypothetical protein
MNVPVVQPLPPGDNPLRGLPAAKRANSNRWMTGNRKHPGVLIAAIAISAMVPLESCHGSQGVEIYGDRSCGEWVKVRSSNTTSSTVNTSFQESWLQENWLLGYLSGMVFMSFKNVLKGTERESLFLWMDNFCRTNPLKSIAQGSNELFKELKKQKGIK